MKSYKKKSNFIKLSSPKKSIIFIQYSMISSITTNKRNLSIIKTFDGSKFKVVETPQEIINLIDYKFYS